MNEIEAAHFAEFFHALHARDPFPWQTELAARVCAEGWPKVMDLPTASGKTACMDVALFALAVRGSEAPRRIFFVVDRRVIVNEAFRRAEKIRDALKGAKQGILKQVAERLTALGGQDSPLDVYALRGGAYRDETWVRSPLQPTVVTSTVDQTGSRLLFRGYGISQETWPIHAGLIANDALLFLDEAHCSKTFASTLEAVEAYRSRVWAPGFIERPFHFVEMTATPGRVVTGEERFGIGDADRVNEVFRKRLQAVKRVHLAEPVKCRKEETAKFADALIKEAGEHERKSGGKRIAILVNRVVMAKAVYEVLAKQRKKVHLVTGRMRPLDRDLQAKDLEPLKSGQPRNADDGVEYVVSTQCLEVGADLDFDVLVSECASMDALQQRFGRLDRTGDFGRAAGAIVVGTWQLSGKDGDPVYRESLKETWGFLNRIATSHSVNMGIERGGEDEKTVAEQLRELSETEREKMRLMTALGPKLLPSHLDALVQTSPRPAQEPDIDLFLHGVKQGNPDVNVIWRRDLNDLPRYDWHKVVALCPPSSLEAMPVPIWNFRKWFAGEPDKQAFGDESDLEISSGSFEIEANKESERAEALIWRGKDDVVKPPEHAGDFRPGDTIVLAEQSRCWNQLGHVPGGYRIDLGDSARLQLKRGITLRLHPGVMEEWGNEPARAALDSLLVGQEIDEQAVRDLLKTKRPPMDLMDGSDSSWWTDFVKSCSLSRYPAGPGWVLEGFFGRKEKRQRTPLLLEQHLDDVVRAVDGTGGDLLTVDLRETIAFAARYHDFGKVDVRFQTWLRNGDRMAAELAPRQLAKSGMYVLKTQSDCGLPSGFRHELLSLLFAEKSDEFATLQLPELALHAIAAHHGYCRPFAPVVLDDEAGCVKFGGLEVCREERLARPAHRLGAGVSDRFWALTREYGWWGLAYLEAVLRLADWNASEGKKVEAADEY